MIAILGGLGAALAWATTMLCSTKASRTIGVLPTLGWVMLVGLVPTVPAVLLTGGSAPHGGSWGWFVTSGCGNVAGLALTYAAVRRGKVGVVAPIASTEGAVAAVLAIALGESLSPGIGTALRRILESHHSDAFPSLLDSERHWKMGRRDHWSRSGHASSLYSDRP